MAINTRVVLQQQSVIVNCYSVVLTTGHLMPWQSGLQPMLVSCSLRHSCPRYLGLGRFVSRGWQWWPSLCWEVWRKSA